MSHYQKFKKAPDLKVLFSTNDKTKIYIFINPVFMQLCLSQSNILQKMQASYIKIETNKMQKNFATNSCIICNCFITIKNNNGSPKVS